MAIPDIAGVALGLRVYDDPRRHKFPKARYRIDNWPTYDAALRDRGDLTVWVTPEALTA